MNRSRFVCVRVCLEKPILAPGEIRDDSRPPGVHFAVAWLWRRRARVNLRPVAFALRRSWFYQIPVLRAGSAVIILIAATWFVERVAKMKWLPF